jgi:hypothetical protein
MGNLDNKQFAVYKVYCASQKECLVDYMSFKDGYLFVTEMNKKHLHDDFFYFVMVK